MTGKWWLKCMIISFNSDGGFGEQRNFGEQRYLLDSRDEESAAREACELLARLHQRHTPRAPCLVYERGL